jgi:hypothetical protein
MNTETILQKLDELSTKVDELLKVNKKESESRKKWLDKQETMKILECSERTLQTLRDKNALHYSNPLGGTKFFYLRKDVELLFEKNFNGDV